MTGGAVDPDRGQITEMFHRRAATNANRPPEIVIGNQTEITQVPARKKVGVSLDKSAQDGFRKISVPIEPWRKKSRSSFDQFGTCARQTGGVGFVPVAPRIAIRRIKPATRERAPAASLRCIASVYRVRLEIAITNESLGRNRSSGSLLDSFESE